MRDLDCYVNPKMELSISSYQVHSRPSFENSEKEGEPYRTFEGALAGLSARSNSEPLDVKICILVPIRLRIRQSPPMPE